MTAQQLRGATSALTLRAGLLSRDLLTRVHSVDRYATANSTIYRRSAQVAIDGLLVAGSLAAAYLLRFDAQIPDPYDRQLFQVVPFAIALSLGVNAATGLYRRVWRFFGIDDALAAARAVAIVFLCSALWRIFEPGMFSGTPVPFGVLLLFPFLAFTAMVAVRLARRAVYGHSHVVRQQASSTTRRKRVLLAGAGEAGLYLLRALRESDFEAVGFLDDDRELIGRTIGGCQVLGTTLALESIVRHRHVDEVIFCMPSAPRSAVQRIAARCERIGLKASTVPTLWEIMADRSAIGQLRPVHMEDLLGRTSVTPPADVTGLANAYAGRRILVTGAGGSIGSELVRQLSRSHPSQLILLDKDENSLYEVTCETREEFDSVVAVVADVRNPDVLRKVFERHHPEVVFHAAAYKHVPLMEDYPAEAILNNVMGTRHVAELSQAFGVQTFVLISTDKAVNPACTMGASKRVAEMILQRLAAGGSATRFCCVRFGNVLGSRASVVPLFQRQIRQGKSITVTHPDVRRYFMTIPEAAQLVIQAGTQGDRGEVFLLDMGDPVRIVDLARNLIELSGLVPEKDVDIEFTGLRPGEKMTEELLATSERGVRTTPFSKIFVVSAPERDWSDFAAFVGALESAALADEPERSHEILRALDIGYVNALAFHRDATPGADGVDSLERLATAGESVPG